MLSRDSVCALLGSICTPFCFFEAFAVSFKAMVMLFRFFDPDSDLHKASLLCPIDPASDFASIWSLAINSVPRAFLRTTRSIVVVTGALKSSGVPSHGITVESCSIDCPCWIRPANATGSNVMVNSLRPFPVSPGAKIILILSRLVGAGTALQFCE